MTVYKCINEKSINRFVEVKDQRKITSVIDINYSFNQNTVLRVRVMFMVFNATVNNISIISWQSVLLVQEIGALGKNH